MATATSIAIRRQEATDRILRAAVALANKHGVSPDGLMPTHKDPAIQAALQLEAFAGFLEDLAAAEPEQVEPAKKRGKA